MDKPSTNQSETTEAFETDFREGSEKEASPTKTPREKLVINEFRLKLVALSVSSDLIRFSRPVPPIKLRRERLSRSLEQRIHRFQKENWRKDECGQWLGPSI